MSRSSNILNIHKKLSCSLHDETETDIFKESCSTLSLYVGVQKWHSYNSKWLQLCNESKTYHNVTANSGIINKQLQEHHEYVTVMQHRFINNMNQQ